MRAPLDCPRERVPLQVSLELDGREIFERKNQLATSFLAILLGVSVIVAMKNITFYSEKAVAYQLDALGANVLVLPKSASAHQVGDLLRVEGGDADVRVWVE
mgnify:CR=1 FL=1